MIRYTTRFVILGLCSVLTLQVLTALPAGADDFIVSTANPEGFIGGPGIAPTEAYAFDSNNPAGATRLVELTIGNLRAFHILDNGNYLLSTNTGSTFGDNNFVFDDDHVVEFNPNTDMVTSYFDFAGVATSTGDLDIDAVAVLPNGDIIFSNVNDVTIGGMTFSDSDVVQFTPNAGSATNVSRLFDGSQITGGDQFNNLSGVSFVDGLLALSVSTGGGNAMMLGGQTFSRNDVVLYDLNMETATLGFEGDNVFTSDVIIDAIHLTIPEPTTAVLALGLIALAAFQRRL